MMSAEYGNYIYGYLLLAPLQNNLALFDDHVLYTSEHIDNQYLIFNYNINI